MSRFLRAASLAAAMACVTAPTCMPAMAADDPTLFTVGAGLWDVNFNYDHQVLEGRIEVQSGLGLFETDSFGGLKPMAGFMANTMGSKFIYGGFASPFDLGGNQRWYFTPSAGVGAYSRGAGLDLGGTFEFHLGVNLSYALTPGSRVGLYLTHISNAGINSHNPGENSLLLTWAFAL